MTTKSSYGISGGWGFAEATLFFLVPDIWLSRLALQNYKTGLVACLWALVGALIGGSVMWLWGATQIDHARSAVELVPAINAELIDTTRAELETNGIVALFVGPLLGIPYKIFAMEAAALGLSFVLFFVVSVPARLIRFVIVVSMAAAAAQIFRHRASLRTLQWIHAGIWIAFYTAYFAFFGL
ncbi:MAG: hypothetical protein AAF351_07340 [Pseudomonadota bacterium]